MSDDDLVLAERHDGFAVVTLNRPDKRNAITRALAETFCRVLEELEDVPVIVLTGAGDRSFSAGMDLNQRSEPKSWRAALGAEHGTFWLEAIEYMRRHPAVFIAAVNGFAVGGGLTLVNNSELAVAADSAEFGMPELGFGSFPALAGPSTVRRILPKHVAQLVFTAERVDARTALAWGIVNEVLPAAEVMPRALELAASLADRDPVALAYCKRGLREMEVMRWSEAHEHGTDISNSVKTTHRAMSNDSAAKNTEA